MLMEKGSLYKEEIIFLIKYTLGKGIWSALMKIKLKFMGWQM